MTTPVRVVLADDHVVVRRGLAVLLGTLPGVVVVGEADDGAQALREVEAHRPDVVVMDLRMPVMDGVEATRRILAARPEVAVLVLTMFNEDALVAEALHAGARGYLLKTADQHDIERALHAVAGGQAIFSSDVVPKVLRPKPSVFDTLSERERAVLDALATGASNATIAARLFLAPKTVANHLSRIFVKLGVDSRAEAIILSRDAGYGRHG